MSKMDAQRAMREAKFARGQARSSGAAPTKTAAAAVAPTEGQKTPAQASKRTDTGDGTQQLCGHRSMNGRTCTRESGHAAKAHRYAAPST